MESGDISGQPDDAYVTSVINKEGKCCVGLITEDWVNGFAADKGKITVSYEFPIEGGEERELNGDCNGRGDGGHRDVITFDAAKFANYMVAVKNEYDELKTVLNANSPRKLSDFYVCNDIEREGGGAVISNADVEKLRGIGCYVIITGDVGLGKTTMMKYLLLDATAHFDTLRLAPIYMPLKHYGGGALYDFAFATMAGFNAGIAQKNLARLLADGAALLLFDGIDELKSAYKDTFRAELEALQKKYPANFYVLSSRPRKDFDLYARFVVLSLKPFRGSQSLEMVDKADYRPNSPEIKAGFYSHLRSDLLNSHRRFAENPLLLSLMLLVCGKNGVAPTKTHKFYKEAFEALVDRAFGRAMHTDLTHDEYEDVFAEIGFRSHNDERYSLTEYDFEEYFNDLQTAAVSAKPRDFLNDACENLCVMEQSGDEYGFIHRSFQEYFAALFLSRSFLNVSAAEKDECVEFLIDFFERRHEYGDGVFDMLYDMARAKVEEYILIPFLEWALVDYDTRGRGYSWVLSTPVFAIMDIHGFYVRDKP